MYRKTHPLEGMGSNTSFYAKLAYVTNLYFVPTVGMVTPPKSDGLYGQLDVIVLS